jgi:hypothetical protein
MHFVSVPIFTEHVQGSKRAEDAPACLAAFTQQAAAVARRATRRRPLLQYEAESFSLKAKAKAALCAVLRLLWQGREGGKGAAGASTALRFFTFHVSSNF